MGLFSMIPASVREGAISSAFDQFDKDKSGQLDKGELQAAIKQVLTTLGKGDMACPDGLVDQVLKQLDKDGSGSVSKEEFTKVADVALKKIEEQEAKKA